MGHRGAPACAARAARTETAVLSRAGTRETRGDNVGPGPRGARPGRGGRPAARADDSNPANGCPARVEIPGRICVQWKNVDHTAVNRSLMFILTTL